MTVSPDQTTSDIAVAQEGLACPLCDYDLRGLPQPRCPECGFASQSWDALRAQLAQQHPYLFEHHPRRNAWSFFRTLIACLRPRRFWRELRPTHLLRLRRLAGYWALLAIFICITLLPTVTMPVYRYYAQRTEQIRIRTAYLRQTLVQIERSEKFRAEIVKQYGSIAQYKQSQALWLNPGPPPPLTWVLRSQVAEWGWLSRTLLPLAAAWILWPWLTLAALLIYRMSMRQARIRQSQVLRCAAYSSTAGLLLAPVLIVLQLAADPYGRIRLPFGLWTYDYAVDTTTMLAAVMLMALMTYGLCIAYRRYLRFPHAIAAVIASQIIVSLVLLKTYLVICGR